MNQEQLIFEIEELKSAGYSRNSKYIEDIINHHSKLQYSHAYYLKAINVLEFMIMNLNKCKEKYLRRPIQENENIINSYKQPELIFRKFSVIFQTPNVIDRIILRYQNDPYFEKYFCHVFFPSMFIGFSSRVFQDCAKQFLINYYNNTKKFNSILNNLSSSFIMSNFAFRRTFLQTYIHDLSNSSNGASVNILIESFFKSTFKLTSQQNDIIEFYIEKDEKAATDFLLNFLIIPFIEFWEFSPFFCSNSFLFKYDIPEDPNASFDFSKKTCALINPINNMENNLAETVHNCFVEYVNGYHFSEESFDILELTNGQKISLPLTKLDIFVCEQIETENISSINYDDCFIVYNEIEFEYNPSFFAFFAFKEFIPKTFAFSLINDSKYQRWIDVANQAAKCGIDPIDYYKQSGSNDQLIDFLGFYKQELEHSKNCRLSINDNFRTFQRLQFELKSMKMVMRDVYIKFIIKFMKFINEPEIDHIMHSLFHEQIESIFLFLKSCFENIEDEEKMKGDIATFLIPRSKLNKFDQLIVNLLNMQPIYSNFSSMFGPYFSVLKLYSFSKFIATVSCNKADLKLTGKVSLRTRGVTKYLNKQVEEIKSVGSFQLDGLSSYGMFLTGMRILAFAFLRENVTKQFDIKSHFVEIEIEKPSSSDFTSKSNDNLADLSMEGDMLNYDIKVSASIDNFKSNQNSFENETSNSLDNFVDRFSVSNSIDRIPSLNNYLAYSNKNGSRSIDSMSALDKSTSFLDDALSMVNKDSSHMKNLASINNSDSFDDNRSNTDLKLDTNKQVKATSILDEKAAIVWEMLKKNPKKITPICKMIDGALKVITSVDDYPNEMKFWMPRKITKDIKMLTIDFGMTLNK